MGPLAAVIPVVKGFLLNHSIIDIYLTDKI